MTSSKLTPAQAYKIMSAIQPSHEYLSEFRAQMENRGIRPYDKLFSLVETAQDAMQQLIEELQNLNYEGHRGSSPSAKESPPQHGARAGR